MKVKVKAGYQLGLYGKAVHQPGEVFDAPDVLAQEWISAGQAVAVKAVPKPKVKAVKASKNKAVTSSANKSTFTASPPTPSTPVVKRLGL